MFINKSFTIAFSNNTLIFNKDVVKRLGDIPTEYFKISKEGDSVVFEETQNPGMDTINVIFDKENDTTKINSKDLVNYIREVLDIKETSFKICPVFLEPTIENTYSRGSDIL